MGGDGSMDTGIWNRASRRTRRALEASGVVALVVLAAGGAWLLTIPYWLSPLEPPPHVWQVFLVLLLTAALSVLAAEPELRRARARLRARAGTRTAWPRFGS